MILNNIKIFDQSGNKIEYNTNDLSVSVSNSQIPENTEYLIFDIPFFTAQEGDDGYFTVSDVDRKGSHLCFFNKKSNFDGLYIQNLMPIFGIKTKIGAVLGVVTGMRYSFHINVGVKDGNYYLKPYFKLNGDQLYEDIKIDFYYLGANAQYSDMAAKYRELQLANGIVPLSEKIKSRPQLKYASESVEIRIRMGWKPVPPQILEQTEENEPEMKVACTFNRVKDLIDELKNQGVEKAQICLVGWNKSGHDGRYPDLFPVEEKLGGEKDLRSLICYAQNNGYQIVCHTNSSDSYSISKRFCDDIVVKKKDGSLFAHDEAWAGGRMYHLSPQKAVEFAKNDLPKVRNLGFSGLHYIDVLTIVPPKTCYDKSHPSNAKQTVESYHEIMKLCHNTFGGFASEGCCDFAAKYLDYGFYVVMHKYDGDFFDREIPLLQMVYHGIFLFNPSTTTNNYTIKNQKAREELLESMGRPSFYIYSKFIDSGDKLTDWLGKEDLLLDTDEQLKYTVQKIKKGYDDLVKYKHLTEKFIIKHEFLTDKKRKTTFSDGSEILTEY